MTVPTSITFKKTIVKRLVSQLASGFNAKKLKVEDLDPFEGTDLRNLKKAERYLVNSCSQFDSVDCQHGMRAGL